MNKLDSKIHNCSDYIIGCDYFITMANLNNVIIVFHMLINDSLHISCHLPLESDYLLIYHILMINAIKKNPFVI